MSIEYNKPNPEQPEPPEKLAEPSVYQLDLRIESASLTRPLAGSYRDALVELLSDDLDFHSQNKG